MVNLQETNGHVAGVSVLERESAVKPKKLVVLDVVIDAGASTIKVIYGKGKGKKRVLDYLVLPSMIIEESQAPKAFLGQLDPVENAWVFYGDGNSYLVGSAAKAARAKHNIAELKANSLVPKVLAVLGIMGSKLDLKEEFAVNLTLLLPIVEITYGEMLESQLRESMAEYQFLDRSLKLELRDFRVYPEGYGVHRKLIGNVAGTTVYLMVGFRNTSMLVIKDGNFLTRESFSTDLGFHVCLEAIAKQNVGLYFEQLEAAIYSETRTTYDVSAQQYVVDGFKSQFDLDKLLPNIELGMQQKVSDLVASAIDNSLNYYRNEVVKDLRRTLPDLNQVARIVLCGGTVPFVEDAIFRMLKNQKFPGEVKSITSLGLELSKRFELGEVAERKFVRENLPLRLADSWGIFSVDFCV